jgi:hypothetical protein
LGFWVRPLFLFVQPHVYLSLFPSKTFNSLLSPGSIPFKLIIIGDPFVIHAHYRGHWTLHHNKYRITVIFRVAAHHAFMVTGTP